MASGSNVRTNVLLRSEQSGGHVSLMDNVVPARTPARPSTKDDFDAAFYCSTAS